MTTAIQDRIPNNHCYGCGPENPEGLQIKSYREDEEFVCRYQPKPSQCAGPEQYVYGGTIASLIDCHSNCSAMAHQYALEGREVGEGETIWCVTAQLNVTYLAPTPIDRPVELRARVTESSGRKVKLACSLYSDGTETARAEVISVRVPASWRNN